MKTKRKKEVIQKTPYDDFDRTQQEIADALGVERSYISTIEARAKAKFKAELEKRGYKMEDLIGGMR